VEVVNLLLNGLSVVLATVQAAPNLRGWFTWFLRDKAHSQKAERIRQWLRDLGLLSPQHVRQVVDTWAKSQKKLTAAQREEVTALLISLIEGARLVSTAGTPRSSYMRSEKLLEQLLTNLQVGCKQGEPVGPGSDWKLDRFLGIGSFGEVWLARNTFHPEPRAYKFFTRPETTQWVRQEQANLASIAERLKHHPNVIRFLDVAITGLQRPYLALEFVGGGSLEDWILEDVSHRQKLDKFQIVKGIVSGLAEAHDNGIMHRDLKPANILLTTSEKGESVIPKVADFGLGRVVEENRPAVSAQMSFLVQVGTTMYLPPEAQNPSIARKPEMDDVFAVGVIWYQLLVEALVRPPYDYAEELRLRNIDSKTIQLIERCLAQPGRRFKDAGELQDALEQAEVVELPQLDGYYDVRHLLREYLASLPG
jgi:hypothetical protein